VEGAYEYLNAEVPKIIAIPDDNEWADIRDIKDLTGAIGKRSFGGSLRSKSKYMNQQVPTYEINTAIRDTGHGLVCCVSIMGKLIIKETPVTNFDHKKPEFLDVTQAIYLEAYGYNSALTLLLKHSLTIQHVLQRQSLSLVWATPTTTATSSSSDLIGNHRSDGPEK
jgi:hypothetical protein